MSSPLSSKKREERIRGWNKEQDQRAEQVDGRGRGTFKSNCRAKEGKRYCRIFPLLLIISVEFLPAKTSGSTPLAAAVMSDTGAQAASGGGSSAPPPPSAEPNVQVCVRLRPATAGETAWSVPLEAPNSVQQVDTKGKASTAYGVDHVFTESSSTRRLFDVAVRGLVKSVVEGYNGTVFAYGQTAAGKTHTMLGDKGNPGILPLAVNEIMGAFSQVRGGCGAGRWRLRARASRPPTPHLRAGQPPRLPHPLLVRGDLQGDGHGPPWQEDARGAREQGAGAWRGVA